jgi:hypothetical protein
MGRNAVNNFDLQEAETTTNELLGIQSNSTNGALSGSIDARVVTNVNASIQCRDGAMNRIAGLYIRVDQCLRVGGVIQSMNLSICDKVRLGDQCLPANYLAAGALPAIGMLGMGNYTIVSHCTGVVDEESCPVEVSATMTSSFNSSDSVALTQQAQDALANQSSTSIATSLTTMVNSTEFTNQLQDAASSTNCYNQQMTDLSTDGDISNCAGTYSIQFGSPQAQAVCTNPTGGISFQSKCTQQNGVGTLNCNTTRTCTQSYQIVNLECNKTLLPDCTGTSPDVTTIAQYANEDLTVYPYGTNLHNHSNVFWALSNTPGEFDIWSGPCVTAGVINGGSECQESKIFFWNSWNQPLPAATVQANGCIDDGGFGKYICDSNPGGGACDVYASPMCYHTKGSVYERFSLNVTDLSKIISLEVTYDNNITGYYYPYIYINGVLAYPIRTFVFNQVIPPLASNPNRVLTDLLQVGTNEIRIQYYRGMYTQFAYTYSLINPMYQNPPYHVFRLKTNCPLVTDNQCASVEAIQ